ncbi:MAG: hypothetical protein V3U65_02920 [Granulosicoccaceae bacterium]
MTKTLAASLHSAGSQHKAIAAVLLLIGFISGCVSTEAKNESGIVNAGTSDSMLEDVLSVLPQLIEPRINSIQFGPKVDELDVIAARNLAKAGYGIQRVSADQGVNFFRADKFENEDGIQTMRVSIGELEITREYATEGGIIVPAGPFELAGTRAQIDPSESMLGSKVGNDAIANNVEYTSIAPIEGGIPTISLLSEDIIQGVVNQATQGPRLTTINSTKLEVKNRFYDVDGTFANLINDRERVAREVIIFPNDSMRLGEEGKQRINKLLNQFSEASDLINVIGCSNGATKLAIGNEGLALGRANRITEELLTLGVPNRSILDDACWSPKSTGVDFPSRGVVIDLMRSES